MAHPSLLLSLDPSICIHVTFVTGVNQLPPWFPLIYCDVQYWMVMNKDFPRFFRFHAMMGTLLDTAMQVLFITSKFYPPVQFNGKLGLCFWAWDLLTFWSSMHADCKMSLGEAANIHTWLKNYKLHYKQHCSNQYLEIVLSEFPDLNFIIFHITCRIKKIPKNSLKARFNHENNSLEWVMLLFYCIENISEIEIFIAMLCFTDSLFGKNICRVINLPWCTYQWRILDPSKMKIYLLGWKDH